MVLVYICTMCIEYTFLNPLHYLNWQAGEVSDPEREKKYLSIEYYLNYVLTPK